MNEKTGRNLSIVAFIALIAIAGAVLIGARVLPTDATPAPRAPIDAGNVVPEAEPVMEYRRQVGARKPAAEGAPNVVFVLGCTVRKDQLTPYGGPAEATPFLANFAESGTKFSDLVAVSAWTKATATAVLTGRHPMSIGLVEPGPGRNELVLDARVTTLAERLVEHGYYALGVTANPNLNREFGLAQGFDHYRDTHRISQDKFFGGEAVDTALAMLKERESSEAERPFFLQMMLVDAHEPRSEITQRERRQFSEEGVSPLMTTYRATLRRFDNALSDLDNALTQLGYDTSNTVWVVLADHGEGLDTPPHHGKSHGLRLYRTTVEVPWLLRGPGIAAGHTVEGLASQVDVAPTLLGVLGLEAPDLEGQDWSQAVSGELATTNRERAYVDTWFYGVRRSGIWTPTHHCQKDYGSAQKYDNLPDACYDRATDPDSNVPLDMPELLMELDSWRDARVAEMDAWGTGESAAVSDDVNAQLEALGYIEN